MMNYKRCSWVNLNNPKYVEYHDYEWGKPVHDDNKLFEMLILESFQAGLSWEIILNKRDKFREAFDNFDIEKIINYDDKKIKELMVNDKIIKNRLKIEATINNAKIFKKIVEEFGSFSKYIWNFSDNKIIYQNDKINSELSDEISIDLKKRGMKFVGTTTIYAYLQAIGIINSHDDKCFLYKSKKIVNL